MRQKRPVLADLLNALRMMGREAAETVHLGVQPSTPELGTVLSTPVQQALRILIETALSELPGGLLLTNVRPEEYTGGWQTVWRFQYRRANWFFESK